MRKKKSDLQWEFLQCLALLIGYARMNGYKLTMGRGYASPKANEADGGHPNSTHLHRLAIDLNLFVDVDDDGKPDWIEDDHPAWTDLGEYWVWLHTEARWGGSWGDFNHFSFEWQGVK